MSDTTMSRILLRIFWMLGGIFAVVSGDLEPTFNRCCNHGVNWGSEGRQCNTFQAPIAGVPNPQQAICLTVVQICCLRRHRELQCEAGKVAARQDRECIVTPVIGGEAFKDCCEACKLGLVSGTMNLGCTMKNYKFGLPWDEAYQSCCVQTIGAAGRRNQAQFGIPTNQVPESPPSYLSQDEQDPLENLCNIFPGQLCAHICLPSPGSYSCSCREGFELMADRKSCQLIGQGNDRCVNDNPCGQICKDTGTGIICSCRSGYKLGLDQKSCIDIDECEVGSHNCDPDSTICVNEEDGFKCIPNEGPSSRTAFIQETAKCPRGFTFNPRSSACDDIDECSSPVSCSSPMICQNTIGSYLCVATSTKNCPPGYSFDSAINSCKDINECLNDPCKTEERCINTLGSFSCQGEKRVQQVLDCPSGYRFNTNTKSCEDIDECASNIAECDLRIENCINRPGGYECFSNSLKPHTRVSATDTVAAVRCDAGYKPSIDGLCADVDECAEKLHACLPDVEECVNENGSYRCETSDAYFDELISRCPIGFIFDEDHGVCEDIDECKEAESVGSNLCGPEKICVNNDGSFTCDVHCNPGFQPDNEKSDSCKDIDECLRNPCNINERCINTEGSYRCESAQIPVQQISQSHYQSLTSLVDPPSTKTKVIRCGDGYRLDSTGKCMDINECAEETHNCTVGYEDCVNTLGGYSCKPLPPCPDGFRREFTTGRCFDVDECKEGTDNCDRDREMCSNSIGSFKCTENKANCPSGHRFNPLTRNCEDINECNESPPVCNASEMCKNSPGSYQCIPKRSVLTSSPANRRERERCPSGFRRRNRLCVDIDECAENTFFCESYEECVNERGGYRCISESSSLKDAKVVTTTIEPEPKRSCPSGYRFSDLSRRCVDINECLEANPCNSETQTCENKVGSYTCQCKHGLRLNPTTRACDDINECSINIHNCLPTQRCDNTIGSFTCTRITSCGTGYTFNSQSGKCEDDDECTEGLDDCALLGPSWVCRNTVGSFRCEKKRCPSGQRLARDGTCITPAEKCTTGYKIGPNWKCVDIDECITNPCQRNSKCVNTPGSYRCVSNLPQCGSGYESNEYGQCVDVDECITGHHDCRSGQACHNRAGGYTCGCMNGFSLNPITKECEDIDECRDRVCDTSTSTCLNTPGSYRCECREGFRKKSENQCIDIDECAETERLCQHRCVNSWGSFKCLCEQGYTLAPDNRACYDVDECEQYRERGRNLCVGQCVNELGSYKCTCPSGYKLAPDGRTCLDIDECAQGNVCQPEETCLNTRGSYRCNSINCPSNYIRDPDHKNRCKRTSVECLSSDNECLRRPISFSYNYLTFTSRIHVPRSTGQLDIFTMRGPVWPTSSVKFDLKFVDTRAPKGVEQAAEEYFTVRRVGFNQCILSLAKAVEGPQDIELHLSMDMYHNGALAGVAVARIYIFVSQYEF
ncbi:fibrillin-1-like isoform X4 [Artemia franciscana]|uniref:fibrillin-1-like isoform X4 n=1 Tax=Artemia franciscana TaxID=6661 RepID=UPI0032DB855A